MSLQQMSEQTKQAVDVVAAGGTFAAIVGWLPQATALLTFLWVAVRLYETRTVQRILRRMRGR